MTKQEFRVQRALGLIQYSADLMPILADIHPDLIINQSEFIRKLIAHSNKLKKKFGISKNEFFDVIANPDLSAAILDWIEDQLDDN